MAADRGEGNGFANIGFVFLLSAGKGGGESVCSCFFVPAPWSLLVGQGDTDSPPSCVLCPQTTWGAFRWGQRWGQGVGLSLPTLLWVVFEPGLEHSSLQIPPHTIPHPLHPLSCLHPSRVHRTPGNDSLIGRICIPRWFSSKADGMRVSLASVYN